MSARTDTQAHAPLEERLRAQALLLGFDQVGIARARKDAEAAQNLEQWIVDGAHGSMDWMARHWERRTDPAALWPDMRSLVMLGMNYGPAEDPRDILERADRGAISVYARNRDYHDLIKKRLKRLARWFAEETGAQVKVFVDTAPLMEKPWAQKAAIGWQGKHTNLVSRQFGSWLFLGALATSAPLDPDEPEADHCGSCHACLDICPTRAFPAPYRLDARRCISYLTIEHKGHIAEEFRGPIGNRIYGCDDCLAVCPWNKYAKLARESDLQARDDLAAPRLADLLRLDDAGFRKLFSGSPVKRIGRDRFVRNVLIAAGNSGDRGLCSAIEPILCDAAPLVRAMAVWALRQLAEPAHWQKLRDALLVKETDADVRREWTGGRDGCSAAR